MDVGRIGNTYGSYYQNESTGRSKSTEKDENVKRAVGSEKKTEAEKNSKILSELQKKFPNVSLTSGYGVNWRENNKTNNIVIHPSILAKMEKDEDAAKEYSQKISYIEAAFKVSDTMAAIGGGKVTYRGFYIDAKGEVWGGAVVERKDSLNEKLRREAEENVKERIDKAREAATDKRKELEEKLEEAKNEKEEDTRTEPAVIEKLEKKVQEALEKGGGRVEFDNKDMKAMLEEAKRRGSDTKIDIKI